MLKGLNFLNISIMFMLASMSILVLMIRFSLQTLWICIRWVGKVLILMQVLVDCPVFFSFVKDKPISTMQLENRTKWWTSLKFNKMIVLQQWARKLRIKYKEIKLRQNKSKFPQLVWNLYVKDFTIENLFLWIWMLKDMKLRFCCPMIGIIVYAFLK